MLSLNVAMVRVKVYFSHISSTKVKKPQSLTASNSVGSLRQPSSPGSWCSAGGRPGCSAVTLHQVFDPLLHRKPSPLPIHTSCFSQLFLLALCFETNCPFSHFEQGITPTSAQCLLQSRSGSVLERPNEAVTCCLFSHDL